MVNKPQTSETASQTRSFSSTQTSSASSQSSKSSKNSVKILRRQFTVQFKLMAVRMYERLGSIRKAAKKLVITRKVLRNWIKIKANLENTIFKRRRHHVTIRRKAFFPELEQQLFQFITDRRNEEAVVTGVTILSKARSIAAEMNLENFGASRGWLLNFLIRHNLVLRRLTSKGKQLPKNAKEILKKFHIECQRKRIGLNSNAIYNMDETNVELDSIGNYSYAKKGSKHVPGATCGHEKAKISIAVTVSADGYVLPAMIIIPRKTPLPNYIPPNNVIVQYKDNSKTFDSDVISNGVLQRIIYPQILVNNQQNPLLIMDSAPCHKTKEVRDKCEEYGINLLLIPPRMTQLVQPCDVSIFKSFKSHFQRRWHEWFLASDHTYTRNGNMRSPSYITVIQWVSEILRDLRFNPLVANSFVVTGITQNDESKYHSPLRHILTSNEVPLNVLDDLTAADELEEVFVDSADDSYSDDELTDVLTESDEEQLESESSITSSDEDSNNSNKRKRAEADLDLEEEEEEEAENDLFEKENDFDLVYSSSSSEEEAVQPKQKKRKLSNEASSTQKRVTRSQTMKK